MRIPDYDPVVLVDLGGVDVRDFADPPDLDLGPATVAAYNGRPPQIVQGLRPIGGQNCHGYVLFDLGPRDQVPMPSRGRVALYAMHWFYAVGGTAILSVVDGRGRRLTEPLLCEGWPRACMKMIDLPEHWLPHFSRVGHGEGIGIGLEEWEDKDPRTYGRFDGARSRLRLWR